MKCEMQLEKNLKGYTNMYITTPKGTKILVNLVGNDKNVKRKLIYKLICEFEEDAKNEKKK